MTRNYERVTCPGCSRSISAYIPHFGDGGGLKLVKHNLVKGRSLACPLSERIIVRKDGTWRLDP